MGETPDSVERKLAKFDPLSEEEIHAAAQEIEADVWSAFLITVEREVSTVEAFRTYATAPSTQLAAYKREHSYACARVLGPNESEIRFRYLFNKQVATDRDVRALVQEVNERRKQKNTTEAPSEAPHSKPATKGD